MSERSRTVAGTGRASGRDDRRRATAGTLSAALCAAIGSGGLAFAAALVLAPSIWPAAARIAPKLAAQGVTPALAGAIGTLWIGFAIAIATERRTVLRFTGEEARLAHRVDRVLAEQTFLRTGLMEQRAETMSLRQDVAAVAALMREEIARAEEARAAEANKEDGLFRVAASLDQLHAKLEERLPGRDEQRTGRHEEFERSLAETLARLEAALQGLVDDAEHAERERARSSSEGEAEAATPAPPTAEAAPACDPAPPEGTAGRTPAAPGFDEEEWEPTRDERAPTEDTGPESIPLESAPSLGLLDAFDDFGEFDATRAEDAVGQPSRGGPLPGTDPRCEDEALEEDGGLRISPRVELP